jgi:hypothetical protein
MKSPRLPPDHEDRLIDCQEQMEDDFVAIVDRARAAGWDHREVLAALAHLAINHIEALAANANTDKQIADAKARQGKMH